MAIFRNLGINQPEADKSSRGGQVCGIACATYQMYASAQSPARHRERSGEAGGLDFLDLAETSSFLDWKLTSAPITKRLIYGWALPKLLI